MDLLNYETPGSERAQIPGLTSNIPYIVNEDYCMLVKITSPATGTGGIYPVNSYESGGPCIVKGEKIWDMGNPKKEFFFLLLKAGKSGYPTPDEVQYQQTIPIYRVGEYSSAGTSGFELHKEEASKISWVAFVGAPPMVLVRMYSSTTGYSVEWRNGQWTTRGQTKTVQTMGTHFYGTALTTGDIYLGYETPNFYLVEMRGYGELAKTISTSINQLRIEIDVDASGKILDLRMIEAL